MWPIVEVENTEAHFRWRMRLGDEVTDWYGRYSGLLVHTFADGRKFGVASAYWSPYFPELKPFQIVEEN